MNGYEYKGLTTEQIELQKRLHEMLSTREEIEEEVASLELLKKNLNAEIEQILYTLPDYKVEVLGKGHLSVMPPSKTVKFDTKKLLTLIAELISDGETHTAQRIADLKSESMRSPYMVYRKSK